MSRRKWAWEAYHMSENESDKSTAMDSIEMAVIEDFIDDLDNRLETLNDMLEEAPNANIKLGLILARNAIRETLDNRYGL